MKMGLVTLELLIVIIQPCSSEWKPTLMTTSNVSISYPLLSEHYLPNSVDKWIFDFKTFLNFTIIVTHLDLEKSKNCKADYLRIDDGTGHVEKIFCGEQSDYANWTHYEFLTYKLTVTFSSDNSCHGTGFAIEVIGYYPNTNLLCESMFYPKAFYITSVVIAGEDLYPAMLNCSWDIVSSNGANIVLDFQRFDIEYSGPDCPRDRLEVWELSCTNQSVSKQLGRFCGRKKRWQLNTNASFVQVRFITDAVDNINGFLLGYKFTNVLERNHVMYKLRATELLNSTPLSSFLPDIPSILIWEIRTQPGFRVSVRIVEDTIGGVLKMYDGPGVNYRRLTPENPGGVVDSNGFYLTIGLDLYTNNVIGATNLSFEASNYFNPSTTAFLFGGKYSLQRPALAIMIHICQMAAIVSPNRHARFNVKPVVNFISKGGNTDDCGFNGIAFYDGRVSFDNMIGPFCDFDDDYTRSILRKMVMSTSVVYIVIYDYDSVSILFPHYVAITDEQCRGFQITERMFQLSRFIDDNKFTLQAEIHNEKRYIHIFYTESTDDCVVVHLLPYQKNLTDILISLTGHFIYRICRQWGLKQHINAVSYLNGSKYDTSETCSQYFISTEQTTHLEETVETVSGFIKEIVVLELGPVSDNLCLDLLCLPNQENQIDLPCGVIQGSVASGCRLQITGSRQRRSSPFIWLLTVGYLVGAYRSNDEVLMVISERYNNTRDDVKTIISNYKIGELRTFTYFSLPGAELHISTIGAYNIDLKFSQRKLLSNNFNAHSLITLYGITCTMYKKHCYTLLAHTVSPTWQSSQLECQRAGGYLVSINTADELDFLKSCLERFWEREFYGKGRGLIFIGLSDTQQAGSYRWEDGSPLTVSDWYYPFAAFDNVLPEIPQPPIELDKIQPDNDSSQRCVAMVPGNPRFSTNWRKVPCGNLTVSSNVYSICEIQNNPDHSQDNSSLNDSDAFRVDIQCPIGWNFVQGICIRLITVPFGINYPMSEDVATGRCIYFYDGIVVRAENIPREVLRNYLISLGFSGGDIWVTLSSGVLGCISLLILSREKLYQERLTLGSDTCQPTGGTVRHVLCETSPINAAQECRSFHFRCEDGTCLNPDRVCDHHPDCLSAEDESNCVLQNSTFSCRSGESISVFRYCDFNVDCEDGSDESECVHVYCSQSQYRCTNGQCIPMERRCDHKSDCVDKSDENLCDWEIECKSFKCPILGCIPFDKVEDLKPDCPDSTEADETINIRDHKRYNFFIKDQNNTFTKVTNEIGDCPDTWDHQRCHQDHIKCFPRHMTCVYDQDIYSQILYCSNGAHLRHCEHFECPDKFKCPASYCIPYHKVCDGVQDCIKGDDEIKCVNRTCSNQLRCGRSNQCVSLEYVCDGKVHCKDGMDDELFCTLLLSDCPSNCKCQGFGVTCSTGQGFRNIPPIDILADLKVLDFGHNNLSVTNSTFYDYRYLVYLYLKNNTIFYLSGGVFEFMSNLLLLDLSNNMLTIIEPGTFIGLQNLRTLLLYGNRIHQIFPGSFVGLSVLPEINLSGMYIEVIENNSFFGLHKMVVLNLSNNFIRYVDQETLSSLSHLHVLSLTHNNLDETKAELFRHLDVKTLHTDSYVFCCNSANQTTECSPALNSYTSCSDLLPSELLQAIVWSFALLAVIGNGGVIIWRLFFEKVHNIPSIFILNLSLADLLMGVYLLSLSIANLTYKGVYTVNDKIWRHSIMCRAIGVISTVSCEMSMFTLVCIAADRSKRLAYPFAVYQFNKKSTKNTMVLGWIVCLFIGVFPFFVTSYFGDYYSRNAVCLPFNFADPLGKGWEFSLIVFVVLNALGLLLVIIMYGLTYFKVKKTQEKAGRGDRADLEVARKLTIIIVTDIICVFPLTMTNLLSVLGEPINRDMASVLTTVILPINSALNPYLFTLSSIELKRKQK